MGAVTGFGATFVTGNPYIGILASIVGGVLMSVLFGFLTLTLLANQVATGLAVTLLGIGLSAVDRRSFCRHADPAPASLSWHQHPDRLLIHPAGLVSWFLFRTRLGLMIRAVGDNHTSAHAMGFQSSVYAMPALPLVAAVQALRAVTFPLPIRHNGLKT